TVTTTSSKSNVSCSGWPRELFPAISRCSRDAKFNLVGLRVGRVADKAMASRAAGGTGGGGRHDRSCGARRRRMGRIKSLRQTAPRQIAIADAVTPAQTFRFARYFLVCVVESDKLNSTL
ncbi:hypothetical protein GWI33_011161, partial [Rhynchophorus ferrugineus]